MLGSDSAWLALGLGHSTFSFFAQLFLAPSFWWFATCAKRRPVEISLRSVDLMCVISVQTQTKRSCCDEANRAWRRLAELWRSWYRWGPILRWCKSNFLLQPGFLNWPNPLCSLGCWILRGCCPRRQNRNCECARRNLPERRLQLNPWPGAKGWENQEPARDLQNLLRLGFFHVAH